ncbi:MAG: LamG-like jellyroll fold domain-containing protein [Promethearchaeota archaeon]
MSSILMLVQLYPVDSENINELGNEEKNSEIETLSLSSNGEIKWWNASFNYRVPINITNPYDETFTHFIANITFNYTSLVFSGKMNESLKDIRIVENVTLRKYFIQKDYPIKDFATVWFENDIVAEDSEQDIFMYYGNENASYASNYLMDKNPDGLMWYKFEEIIEESSRDVVVDSMGNYNATVYDATIASGMVGNAMSFDKSDLTNLAIQGLHYTEPLQIEELTICLWFNTSYNIGSTYYNWAFIDFDRSEYFNFFIRPDNGRLGFSTSSAGDTTDDFYGLNSLNDGNWHFGAALYDGDDKYLYYKDATGDLNDDNTKINPHDGANLGDDEPRYGFMGCGSEATTEGGSKNGADNYYTGLLDEVRVFNESISKERIEWIAKNYKLHTEMKDEEAKEATVKIYVKDIDGRMVPGAEVFIFNETQLVNYTETTGELGYADFLSVEVLYYNITVSYTLFDGTDYNEIIIFNSSKAIPSYGFTDVKLYEVYITVNLWSIDFEIKDVNEEAMGYGYVLVYNKSDYTDLIANLTLDKDLGTTTFRGTNISDDATYYYKVYYNNKDYTPPRPLLDSGIVNRTAYLNDKLNDTSIIWVNKTSDPDLGSQFVVGQKVYATGSNQSHIGNVKIINATIALRKMEDTIMAVSIYSIDNTNTISTNPIYQRPDPPYSLPTTEDTIKLNITEFGDIYGLSIVVEGTNSTGNCNGTIATSFSETCNKYVKVQMSKLRVKVYDSDGIWKSEWGSVRVNIVNGSTFEPITSLLTDAEGIAKGEVNSELDFWYISGKEYNFSLSYGGDKRNFNVTAALDQWELDYDYTLTTYTTLEFRIQTSIVDFVTIFEVNYSDTINEWGQDFTFRIRFLSTSNYTTGRDWEPIIDADFVNWEITDLISDIVYDSGKMTPEVDGYLNYSFNSAFLVGGEQYYFKIYGEKSGYQNPTPLQILFTVSSKNTSIGVYNTSNPAQNLGNNVTLYYGETIQLTIFYNSGALLQGATVTYEWQFFSNPISIIDSIPGYYNFTIDTSIADVGTYKIDINAAQENYSSQYFRFDIVIINRPTSLNDDTSLHHISRTLWVRESHNFTLEYKDILSEPNVNLIDLDQAYYVWYEVANGAIIGSISNPIDLLEGPNSTYILDFNTESKEVGTYALFVTMQKNNYETRTALIDLTIQKRIITWDFNATNLVQNQIKIVQGKDISLEIELRDLSDPTNPESITGATVTLTLGSREYELIDVDGEGIYTYTFTTGSIDTFFAQKVFSGDINISKEDYVSTSIPITIVIEMTEIFPGFPMFYFVMIVGSAIAVVGSLTTYRIVQQRRIPTFVKKARSMKKSIKGNKTISDSLLYPSKDEVIVQKLGNKWNSIGLSLEDIMGVKEKKKMKLPEAKEEFKGGAD